MQVNSSNLDLLTKLPTSEFFKNEAGKIIKYEMKTPVILSLDISNFKYFNQVYGYAEGDKLVERCAYSYCHMNADCVLAYRIYVDHIIMLIEAGNRDMEELRIRYDEFNANFSAEVNAEYPQARIRMYMGAYCVEDVEESISSMIDKAQFARRSIKTNYSMSIVFFSQEMETKIRQEAGVIPMFFSALESGRIEVYIQPKFAIDEQTLIGAEALSRIIDTEGNVVPPKEYIDILEKTGLISRLDNYVIMKVAEYQKEWMNKGFDIIPISVNLSHMDFWEPGFIAKIDEAISKTGVPAKYFEFELTETLFCENISTVTSQIEFLKSKGYRISMDDFGSGYNSLYMLGMFPLDVIKFDRGFVENSLTIPSGQKILKSLMNTFKDVDFDVICEGVENSEEEKMVRECGCNCVQGYLYDKPLPCNVFEDKYMRR